MRLRKSSGGEGRCHRRHRRDRRGDRCNLLSPDLSLGIVESDHGDVVLLFLRKSPDDGISVFQRHRRHSESGRDHGTGIRNGLENTFPGQAIRDLPKIGALNSSFIATFAANLVALETGTLILENDLTCRCIASLDTQMVNALRITGCVGCGGDVISFLRAR